jgi:glucose-6-phosphate 1-dehydrogenase
MSATTLTAEAASGLRAAPARTQAAATSASARPCRTQRPASRPDNHIIVTFGATGDRARRKLLPGLFRLAAAGLVPGRYQIIGSSRRHMTDSQFCEHARRATTEFGAGEPTGEAWQAFARRLPFASADPARTLSLVDAVAAAERQIGGTPARLFHLAVPPAAFEPTVTMLGAAGLGPRIPCHRREAVRRRPGLRPRPAQRCHT